VELLILGAVIGVITFIFNIFCKYKEGREAVVSLAKVRSDLYKSRSEMKGLEKSDEKNKERIEQLERAIYEKDGLYSSFESMEGLFFSKLSSLMADFKTIQYAISAKYLTTKKHPAHKEAQRIKELRKQTKEVIEHSKLAQYKYEYLFTLFPDLEMYVDSAEELDELNQFDDLNDLQNNSDRTKKYLSKDEYRALPEDERNQLALDRYIDNQKSKWEIGRDYELYIGYAYTSAGWDVEYFGIDKQLNDMGRDLIAKKDGVVHVIQCKYWAKRKLIHEKHIAQLYGTTIQYKLSGAKEKKVVPVFVTNITLSDTAKKFADYLNVKHVEKKDFESFPRIKCNVNCDEYGKTKIYHLPMDQQYDRTKISGKNDCFAYTVKEAMNKGFRRAYKWSGGRD
tara:strand:- start:606563 stop:607747 length:1185 start_codon:yes stop_codon:yes gene_type:complete